MKPTTGPRGRSNKDDGGGLLATTVVYIAIGALYPPLGGIMLSLVAIAWYRAIFPEPEDDSDQEDNRRPLRGARAVTEE